jgi:guanine deaminase
VILARGSFSETSAGYRGEDVVDLRGGVLLPGLVDTHVHYPQVRVIGGLGMPLLDWLERCALPEEAKLADETYAQAVASEFLAGLVGAGTTTALVFGAHFATAMEVFFAAAHRSGLRITAGQVLSDRVLRPELLTDRETALAEGQRLIDRWHGHGRLRYAVTPRFSLSASESMLDACAELMQYGDEVWFTSHMNENTTEVAQVVELFAGAEHYLGSYHNHGLVTPRSVFAHNVHPQDAELELLASTRAWVAHCPTSNAALGSGFFPLRRHVEHGVRVALGSDVGGGTGFSLFKEGLQAYFLQQLLGADGLPLTPVHLLYLCTRAGAQALGLDDRVGDLRVGKEFDAVWLRPHPGSTLDGVLEHAVDEYDALGKIFALATPADIGQVWVRGVPVG